MGTLELEVYLFVRGGRYPLPGTPRGNFRAVHILNILLKNYVMMKSRRKIQKKNRSGNSVSKKQNFLSLQHVSVTTIFQRVTLNAVNYISTSHV